MLFSNLKWVISYNDKSSNCNLFKVSTNKNLTFSISNNLISYIFDFASVYSSFFDFNVISFFSKSINFNIPISSPVIIYILILKMYYIILTCLLVTFGETYIFGQYKEDIN